MVEDVFRIYPSYVPLLSQISFSAAPASKLQQALKPLSGFLRESTEDGGILWGVRANPREVLHRLGAQREETEAAIPGNGKTLSERGETWLIDSTFAEKHAGSRNGKVPL